MPVYIEQRVYICAKSVMNDSYVKHPSKLHDSITGFVESKGFLDTIYFTENPIPGQRVVLCFDFYETVHASFDMFDFIEKSTHAIRTSQQWLPLSRNRLLEATRLFSHL